VPVISARGMESSCYNTDDEHELSMCACSSLRALLRRLRLL
jgi:hypothetical protein